MGNSIVNGMGKEAATVDRLAKRGFKGAFDPSGYGSSALDSLTLEDLSGPPLSNNPTDAIYQPDAARYTARRGDSISEIVGTSDPVAVEAFMRANNLSDSRIYAGHDYVLPSEADYAASTGQLGQATLNADNVRLAEYAARDQMAAEARGSAYFDEQLVRSMNTPGASISATPLMEEAGVLSTVGKYALGGAETVLGGVYNYGVRLAGGMASIPYLLDSVDAAVGVQEGFSDRYSYDSRSQGAHDIGAALRPVGQYVENNLLNPARGYSEAHIGDAGTMALFAGAQAAVEIGGVVLTGGALGAGERIALGEINLAARPAGIQFEGTVFRLENASRVETSFDVHAGNIAADHRYSSPGFGAVYGATAPETALAEVEYYGVAAGRVSVSKEINLGNVLDLTNSGVRGELGVTLEQITGNSYSTTHQLGNFARTNGYNGILAPSARHVGGTNLVMFP